ncbi:hypothetical protein Tco_0784849 [Tanacetum coccineum]
MLVTRKVVKAVIWTDLGQLYEVVEFEKLVKSIERFMPMETEERVKRQGVQLEQEFSKKQKIIENDIPTATKPPSIVDWKIIPQIRQKAVYQIIRSDGSYKIYMSFGAILKDFSRDDLTELYRLVIKKYGANRPEEMYDIVLWGDLKTIVDPPLSDDAIWDRKYPLSKDACQVMLKMKLLDGTMDEVCYQLLKMIEKQAGLRL